MNWQLGLIFALAFVLVALVIARGKSKRGPGAT
jgi:hypothetical protein